MFSKGDKAVYPLQGGCVVSDIVEREVGTERKEYLVLSMLLSNMKVMVPVANAEVVGLRPISDVSLIPALEAELLRQTENTFRGMTWNRRSTEYMELMKTGDIIQVATVVRLLKAEEKRKKLSTGEKRILLQAKQIMLSELMLMRGITVEESEAWLEEVWTRQVQVADGK